MKKADFARDVAAACATLFDGCLFTQEKCFSALSRVIDYNYYRSHFGSRYKLGCCGHAGLFFIAARYTENYTPPRRQFIVASWNWRKVLIHRSPPPWGSCASAARNAYAADMKLILELGLPIAMHCALRDFSQRRIRSKSLPRWAWSVSTSSVTAEWRSS